MFAWNNNVEYMASIGQLFYKETDSVPSLLIVPTNVENQNSDLSSIAFTLFDNTLEISLSRAYTKIQRRIWQINTMFHIGNNWTNSTNVPLDLFSNGCHKYSPEVDDSIQVGDVSVRISDFVDVGSDNEPLLKNPRTDDPTTIPTTIPTAIPTTTTTSAVPTTSCNIEELKRTENPYRIEVIINNPSEEYNEQNDYYNDKSVTKLCKEYFIS